MKAREIIRTVLRMHNVTMEQIRLKNPDRFIRQARSTIIGLIMDECQIGPYLAAEMVGVSRAVIDDGWQRWRKRTAVARNAIRWSVETYAKEIR